MLFAFSRDEPRLVTRQIAERTGIPLPTTYRYVSLLRQMGLLLADPEGRLYLSPRFIALGITAEAADAVIDSATPLMTELAARTRETVLLVRLVADSAVCVRRIDSSHRLRISFELGQPLPLEHGASGKVLLSSLPEVERLARLERLASTLPEMADRLHAELPQIAARGWATSEEEINEGIWAVSAAVRVHEHTVAALTIPMPLSRVTLEGREQLRQAVCETAVAIATALCGGSSDVRDA